MEPNKCNKKKCMKIFIYVFPMIFQSLMGLGKSKCDIPNGTTQGLASPNGIFFLTNIQKVSIYKTTMLTSF